MLRCIRSTGKVGELARGKYCSFQLQGSVVIVSCHEIQTSRGFVGGGVVVLDTTRATCGLHFESLRYIPQPRRKVLFVFIKCTPVWSSHGNRPLGFPWICDRIKLLYCQAGGRCRRANPRKPVHQNLLELTKFWLHTRQNERGTDRRSRMGNGTRFHGIPLRIRPVIGSNARILKIRNSSLLKHRPISRDFLIFALLRINGGGESC